jgi:hypothetical protein
MKGEVIFVGIIFKYHKQLVLFLGYHFHHLDAHNTFAFVNDLGNLITIIYHQSVRTKNKKAAFLHTHLHHHHHHHHHHPYANNHHFEINIE